MSKNTSLTKGADLTRERLEKRLAELQQERDAYVKQAEQQIATYNGAILMLEELLNGDGPDEDDSAE
jgi:uncharacterized protein (DUF3084 family)